MVTLTNASPHPRGQLRFKTPDCQDMSISKGSYLDFAHGLPDQSTDPNWLHQLQTARLFAARGYKKIVSVKLDPESEGYYAWVSKKSLKANPYKKGSSEYKSWLKGYQNNES